NPQLEAIGMLERPDHPAVGRRTVPGIPWRLANGPNGLRRPAPMLGEHTREVLTELLGFDAAEVEDLVEQGVLPGLC
ncbi:MAG: CoA:oxalate CoA-transferase, partial [Acidimicrobiia bacterium]|nr:CoA:oxalate CoA-transferase [Acidimicrobiia bacterium]